MVSGSTDLQSSENLTAPRLPPTPDSAHRPRCSSVAQELLYGLLLGRGARGDTEARCGDEECETARGSNPDRVLLRDAYGQPCAEPMCGRG